MRRWRGGAVSLVIGGGIGGAYEEGECLLEFRHLLFRQRVRLYFGLARITLDTAPMYEVKGGVSSCAWRGEVG